MDFILQIWNSCAICRAICRRETSAEFEAHQAVMIEVHQKVLHQGHGHLALVHLSYIRNILSL